jgi:hypothetical protein
MTSYHRPIYNRNSLTQGGNQVNECYFDHDRISIGSMSVLKDLNKLNGNNHNNNNNNDSAQNNANPSLHNHLSLSNSNRKQSLFWKNLTNNNVPYIIGANITELNHGLCGKILLGLSWFLIIVFFPLSMFVTIKVVQEYE